MRGRWRRRLAIRRIRHHQTHNEIDQAHGSGWCPIAGRETNSGCSTEPSKRMCPPSDVRAKNWRMGHELGWDRKWPRELLDREQGVVLNARSLKRKVPASFRELK